MDFPPDWPIPSCRLLFIPLFAKSSRQIGLAHGAKDHIDSRVIIPLGALLILLLDLSQPESSPLFLL